MQKKKRAITLLETLIALGLITILLSCLFSFLVETSKTEKKMEETRAEITQRAHFQMRMQSLLSSIDKTMTEPYLYTISSDKPPLFSLNMYFDHGIDPDPMFSGVLFGKILLDENHNLVLIYGPTEDSSQQRKELLFAGLKSFELEFLAQSSSANQDSFRPITPNVGWSKKRLSSERGMPSIIRAFLYEKKRKEPLRFAFILPSAEPLITYIGGKT